MPSEDLPPSQTGAPENPAPQGRRSRKSTRARKRKAWIASGVAAAVLVGGTGTAVVLLNKDAERTPQAAPIETLAATPTPDATVGSKVPKPVGIYKQVGPPAGSPLNPVDPLNVTVGNVTTGHSLKKGLVGMSLELTDLARPSLSKDNASLVALWKSLNSPMIRFGGNSVERRAFWTSTGEPMPGRIKGERGHVAATITPADLQRLKGLLDVTDAKAALVVDLATFEPERAADFMKHAKDILGDRLLAYTPGNEPNGYEKNNMRPAGWGEAGYLEEAHQYADAINKAAPGLPIAGPGTYELKWGRAFAKEKFPSPSIYAFHFYPFSTCNGGDGGAPKLSNLLSSSMREAGINFRTRMMEEATKNNLPVWIPETGTSACPGYQNETTKTHASSLWSVDYVMSSGMLGVDRLGFHSSLDACVGGPSMSSVCNTGTMNAPGNTFTARANFWGESFAANVQPGKYLTAEKTGDPLSYAYAIANGENEVSVVLVNMNDPQTSAQTQVSIKLPFAAARGTMTQLYGPGYMAEGETLIDGKAAAPVAEAKRPGIPGYTEGDTVKLPITAGTATVLTFRR